MTPLVPRAAGARVSTGRPPRGAHALPRLLGLLLVLTAPGCASDDPRVAEAQPVAPSAAQSPSALAGTDPAPGPGALATAMLLSVKGRAPKTGYDRDLFGSGWIDVDRNGCDTRNDMLARDLVDERFKAGTGSCVVLTGTLLDPYSSASIAFTRGSQTSTAVQIDHVVALSDAWQKGAQAWDGARRIAFANDPMNLLAVDGPLNRQKSDGDTATWLPPSAPYRCQYVARQVAVKHTYGLWVTAAERDAMVRILSTCPGQALPSGADAAPVPAPGSEVFFASCGEARAAGAAPVHAADPGYSTTLDRDRDGIGCE